MSCPLRIYRHNNTLGTIAACSIGDKVWVLYRRGVDAYLVGSGIQQSPDIFNLADPAAHRQRDEHLRRDVFNNAKYQAAVIGAGGNVEKGQLICSLLVIPPGYFDRISCISQRNKIDAFDNPAICNVEAGDDTFCQAHGYFSIIFSIKAVLSQPP
jgi:hypothetical protein